MPAYLVAVPVQMAPEPLTAYREGIEATLAAYGGRYAAPLRGRREVLEGEWPSDDGVVILEFPSYEHALAWYRSPEYAPLPAMRRAGDRWNILLVNGVIEGGSPYEFITSAQE
jgi:uncharacterized protein (DUF1330 family)